MEHKVQLHWWPEFMVCLKWFHTKLVYRFFVECKKMFQYFLVKKLEHYYTSNFYSRYLQIAASIGTVRHVQNYDVWEFINNIQLKNNIKVKSCIHVFLKCIPHIQTIDHTLMQHKNKYQTVSKFDSHHTILEKTHFQSNSTIKYDLIHNTPVHGYCSLKTYRKYSMQVAL